MKRKPINKKIRTNISLSKDMYDKIKQYDLSLSPFVEIRLREYFALIEKPDYQYQHTQYTQETHVKQQRQSQNVTNKTSKTFPQQRECGYRDSNPSDWLGKPIS